MKLAHPELTNVMEWDYHSAATMIVEDPTVYMQFVSDLTRQNDGGEGLLVFSENQNLLDLHKSALVIRDLWSVDINQKKIVNGVLSQLKTIAMDEYFAEITDILQNTEILLEKLAKDSMLPLCWEDTLDITVLLKTLGFRLEQEEDPLARLLDYVCLAQEFLHIRLLILVGVRGYLTDALYETLCKELASREISVFFLDCVAREKLPFEKQWIIDKDHCELLFN